jgi:hypothetical protein
MDYEVGWHPERVALQYGGVYVEARHPCVTADRVVDEPADDE